MKKRVAFISGVLFMLAFLLTPCIAAAEIAMPDLRNGDKIVFSWDPNYLDSVAIIHEGNSTPDVTMTVSSGDTLLIPENLSVTVTGAAAFPVSLSCGSGVSLTLDNFSVNNSAATDLCAVCFTGANNNLILNNTSTVISGQNEPGIRVEAGTSLTISGAGQLTAVGGTYAAGIGSGFKSSFGDISIAGGTIIAAGGSATGSNAGGAGIGGGAEDKNDLQGIGGGSINISAGVINATGGNGGAGIGGGNRAGGGTVNITGGNVTATGGKGGAGIGGGRRSTATSVNISGAATVSATGGEGGAGVGSGRNSDTKAVIQISGGTITAVGGTAVEAGTSGGAGIGGGDSATASVAISGGDIHSTGGAGTTGNGGGAGIGTGGFPSGNTKSGSDNDITITAGTISANGAQWGAGIGAGGVGDNNTGTLTGGTILIQAGTVTANGGTGAAGIGGGRLTNNAGSIAISGGAIDAIAGDGGAGIGGGRQGDGGTIAISGGVVSANGATNGAGIGSGHNSSSCGDITISGGIVYAGKGVPSNPYDIGVGANDVTIGFVPSGALTISGTAAVFLKYDTCVVPTLTVPHKHTTNQDTLIFDNSTVYGITVPSAWTDAKGGYFVLYSLLYDINQGSGTLPSNVIDRFVNLTATVGSGSQLQRTNYEFAGWNTSGDGTGNAYAAGDMFTFTADTTLYAQWTPYYTLTYDVNGGVGQASAVSQLKGTQIAVLDGNGFSRTNYQLTGWNTKADGTGQAYEKGAAFTFAADTTLYAQWKSTITYGVLYNPNNGSGTMVDPNSPYQPESTVTILANTFTAPSGMNFKEWNTKADGTGISYAPGKTLTVQQDTILYAIWQINGSTVTVSSAVPLTGDTKDTSPWLYASVGFLALAAGCVGVLYVKHYRKKKSSLNK